jgi:hypothetical protein
MMTGVIEGGWEFVIAAYVVTALALGLYTLSVAMRYRSERARLERERAAGPEVSS